MPKTLTYDCMNCGKTVIKENTSHNYKYCSLTCQHAYQRKHLIEGLINGDYVGKQLKFSENIRIEFRHGQQVKRQTWAKAFLSEWYDHTCQECGISDHWNGKPLTLQVDHIDGDALNKDLENLSLLCPNCHSQTHTFANKRGRGASTRTWRRKKNA